MLVHRHGTMIQNVFETQGLETDACTQTRVHNPHVSETMLVYNKEPQSKRV